MHADAQAQVLGFRVRVRVQGLGRAMQPAHDLGDAYSLVVVLGQHVAQPCSRLLLLHVSASDHSKGFMMCVA